MATDAEWGRYTYIFQFACFLEGRIRVCILNNAVNS